MCKFIETSKEFNDATTLYAQALGTLSASVKKEKLERAQKLIDKTITDEETKIGNMELVMATISAEEKALPAGSPRSDPPHKPEYDQVHGYKTDLRPPSHPAG